MFFGAFWPQTTREIKIADFQSFDLSVEYLKRIFWREEVVIKLAVMKPLQREATDALIQTIAERDQDMADALTGDWNSSRFPDAAAKREPVVDLEPKDQLHYP